MAPGLLFRALRAVAPRLGPRLAQGPRKIASQGPSQSVLPPKPGGRQEQEGGGGGGQVVRAVQWSGVMAWLGLESREEEQEDELTLAVKRGILAIQVLLTEPSIALI